MNTDFNNIRQVGTSCENHRAQSRDLVVTEIGKFYPHDIQRPICTHSFKRAVAQNHVRS